MGLSLGIGLGVNRRGGGAAAAPAGAVFATASHPTGRAVDAAHLVPAAAGDPIRWQRELVSGVWYEQATSGLRSVAGESSGKWYDGYDGTREHPYPSQPLPVGEADRTIGVAFRASSLPNVFNALVWYGTPDFNKGVFVLLSSQGAVIASQYGDSVASAPGRVTTNQWYRTLFVVSGSVWTLYLDSVSVASRSMLTNTVGGDLLIGASALGDRFSGDIARVAVWPTALSGAGLTAADAWLREGYP